MLKYQLLHPEILAALGTAGHGARVLIADGNYPFTTKSHPNARRVYLNLAPDLLRATDVLATLADAIPIEAAHVMVPESADELLHALDRYARDADAAGPRFVEIQHTMLFATTGQKV